MDLRILYFGVPLGARVLTDAGYPPTAACFGPLDLPGRRWARRRLAGRLILGLPDLRDPVVHRTLLTAGGFDAILSFFWPTRIPPHILGMAPAYGTHPSLLPRHRGPDPYFWTIRAGDEETGVTLHRLDATYDTGAIVAARRVPVAPDDTAWSLARKLDRPALALLVELVAQLATGRRPSETPQPTEGVTEAPRPSEQDLAIDWSQSAEAVVALVRAAAPHPGAGADFDGHFVEVFDASVAGVKPPPGLDVAEAWTADGSWYVRCGRGAVRLDGVRGEDGEPAALRTWLGRPGSGRS